MLKALTLAALILSSSAFAGHLDTVCENAIGNAPVFDTNYVARRNSSGKFAIETLEGVLVTETGATIKSMVRDGGSIWVLTATQIVELNTAGEVQEMFDIENSHNPAWVGLSMIQFNRSLIVSQGAAGIVAFDMEERKFTWRNALSGTDDGYPSGLATDGAVIYAASATSHERGFTGILILNPETGATTKKVPYDLSWGVLDTDVKARMYGDSLVLNNGGWVHLITKKQLDSAKTIKPRWVAQMIPADGPVNAHYMMLTGEFLMHGDMVMGCGVYTAQEDGNFVRKSKLVHIKMP